MSLMASTHDRNIQHLGVVAGHQTNPAQPLETAARAHVLLTVLSGLLDEGLHTAFAIAAL